MFDNEPLLAYFYPYWYRSVKRKRALKNRDPWEVFLLWQKEDIDMQFVARISRVIASVAEYPSSLFVPEDEFLVLVADYDGSFTDCIIWQDLQKKIFCKRIEYEELFNAQSQYWSYLEFLYQITPYS